MLVISGDFLQPHFYGDVVQHLAIDHFAAHFGKKAFPLVGIFHEQIISDDSTKDSIPKVFQSFVVVRSPFTNRPVRQCSCVQADFPGIETQNV